MFGCFECIKASMHLAVVCVEVWDVFRGLSAHVQWLVDLTCTICTILSVHSCLDASSALMHLAVVCIEVWGIWRFGELLNWTKQFTPKVKNSTADRAFVNSLELICTEKKSRKSSTVQRALWIHNQYVLKQIKQFKAENEEHSKHTLFNLSAFCVKENNTTGTVTSKHFYTKQSDNITV